MAHKHKIPYRLSAPRTTFEDIEAVRGNLRAMPGTITLKPWGGVLWAHPNAKGPARGPLEGLRINTPESGSGGSQPTLSSIGYGA
jgi:hypothetical protein